MKKKDFNLLRSKDIQELKKMALEKKKEAILAFASMKSGKEKNFKKSYSIRKEVARILTLIKEKEILRRLSDDSEKKSVKQK